MSEARADVVLAARADRQTGCYLGTLFGLRPSIPYVSVLVSVLLPMAKVAVALAVAVAVAVYVATEWQLFSKAPFRRNCMKHY